MVFPTVFLGFSMASCLPWLLLLRFTLVLSDGELGTTEPPLTGNVSSSAAWRTGFPGSVRLKVSDIHETWIHIYIYNMGISLIYLVGGLEHFSHNKWDNPSQLTNIFQTGWNHQPIYIYICDMYVYWMYMWMYICMIYWGIVVNKILQWWWTSHVFPRTVRFYGI